MKKHLSKNFKLPYYTERQWLWKWEWDRLRFLASEYFCFLSSPLFLWLFRITENKRLGEGACWIVERKLEYKRVISKRDLVSAITKAKSTAFYTKTIIPPKPDVVRMKCNFLQLIKIVRCNHGSGYDNSYSN